MSSSLHARIYEAVARVPRGRVAAYGQIASVVQGATARVVGYALAALPEGLDVPWHRIVNARGEVSPRSHDDGHTTQRVLLEREGVAFDARGRIDLSIYRTASDTLDEESDPRLPV